MRARITQRLIEERGFNFVAAEADWPDAARHRLRGVETSPIEIDALQLRRGCHELRTHFVDWLHKHNATRAYDRRAAFYGLDLYSLYNSVRVVLSYLETVDPKFPVVGGTLRVPQSLGSRPGRLRTSSTDRGLSKIRRTRRFACPGRFTRKATGLCDADGERFFDAAQNARLIANAERYARCIMARERRGTCATATCSKP